MVWSECEWSKHGLVCGKNEEQTFPDITLVKTGLVAVFFDFLSH